MDDRVRVGQSPIAGPSTTAVVFVLWDVKTSPTVTAGRLACGSSFLGSTCVAWVWFHSVVACGAVSSARATARPSGPGPMRVKGDGARVYCDVDVRVETDEALMQIRDLARRAGVTTRTLRYYEEKGLLDPERLPNGYRRYTDHHVETVRRIRFLLAAGINTDMAREVLPCMLDDGGFLAPTCQELVIDFERERERIDRQIAELESARASLDAIITAGRQRARCAQSAAV
jgi:DNA-binding transcriptional MerR regulator